MDNDLQIKLCKIQSELKAPKKRNAFNKYNFRSCEDIFEALKPFLAKHGVSLIVSDKLVFIGNRYYVEATASILYGKDAICVSALARETETKKGMDEPQITGTASSYARKYAICGLFCIDDNKDLDGEPHVESNITKEQANEILDKITEKGIDLSKFLAYMKADEVFEIPATKYKTAIMAINSAKGKTA